MEEASDDRGDRRGDLGRDLAAPSGDAPAGSSGPAPGGGARSGTPSSQQAEQRRTAQAALSLEISRLVARVTRGEMVDIAARGEALAFRFPDAGMSGAMIAKAIENAAGMVGMMPGGRSDTSAAAPASHHGASLAGDAAAAALRAEFSVHRDGRSAEAAGRAPPAGAEEAGKRDGRAGTGGAIARAAAAAVRRAFFRGRNS